MHSSSAPVSRRRVSAPDLTSPSSEPPRVASSARTSRAVSSSAASAGSVQSSSVADIMTQSLMGWAEVTSARLRQEALVGFRGGDGQSGDEASDEGAEEGF